MSTKFIKYHKKKFVGVYYYELLNIFQGQKDRCLYINYKVGQKLKWEKIGKLSEGYSPADAEEIRANRVKTIRHGEELKTRQEIQTIQSKNNIIFKELASIYFEIKGKNLKGFTTDFNRYKKHLANIFDKLRIQEIKPQHIDILNKKMSQHKTATLWNTLELLRRIVNYGYKTNRCSALTFNIEMPKKDNICIEYLKADEVQSLLAILNKWENKSVANMLLLAFFTGMRRSEIFGLKTDDIDFTMNLINIRNSKSGYTSTIGLSTFARNIIDNQINCKNKNYPTSLFLFPGKNGKRRKDCKAVYNIKQKANLPVNFRIFHGLRHHFAVTLANSGQFSIDLIADMLTHKNSDFTKKRYGQFLPETITTAANKAAEILKP